MILAGMLVGSGVIGVLGEHGAVADIGDARATNDAGDAAADAKVSSASAVNSWSPLENVSFSGNWSGSSKGA